MPNVTPREPSRNPESVPRRAINARLRYEILRRDAHTCRYCGGAAPEVKLTVDHVVPVALGGTDDPSNLVTACKDCNAGKTSMPADAALVEQVNADALRWSGAMERAAAIQAERRREIDEYVKKFDEMWCCWSFSNDEPGMRPSDWSNSVRHWFTLGIDPSELAECIDIGMGNQRITNGRIWRYVCGVVWRRIEKRQEIAAEILAAEDGVTE